MAIVATNLKKGQCIKYQGETGIVLGLDHRTPGKGNALIAATIRSFQSGKTKSIPKAPTLSTGKPRPYKTRYYKVYKWVFVFMKEVIESSVQINPISWSTLFDIQTYLSLQSVALHPGFPLNASKSFYLIENFWVLKIFYFGLIESVWFLAIVCYIMSNRFPW